MVPTSLMAVWWYVLAGAQGAPLDVSPGELSSVVENATPGQALRILPGIHDGPITIGKSLLIQAMPGAILRGAGSGTVLTLAADGIEVSGLTITGGGSDLSNDDTVVLLAEANNITVRDCRVEANAFGIYVRRGSGHHLLSNTIIGDSSLPSERRGNGIHLWHTASNEVRGNTLADTRDGIYLSFAHDNQIMDNHGTKLRYGIHYMYSERNTLSRNEFSSCTGGIALMFSRNNQITANITLNNQRFGILCQQIEKSVISDNDAFGNGRGVFLENSSGNSFRNNAVGGNGVGVFLTAGSEGNVLWENSFVGNVVQVFRDRSSAGNRWVEGGRGNFWSDYLGFDWDGDGIGETPYQMAIGTSALLARYPATRWLWKSPLVLLMDWWEGRHGDPSALRLDSAPLVRGRGHL